MVIQDWERERIIEDIYLMEKQFEMECEYYEWVNKKPAKIIIDDKIKRKPRAFRRTGRKGLFFRHSIFANVY